LGLSVFFGEILSKIVPMNKHHAMKSYRELGGKTPRNIHFSTSKRTHDADWIESWVGFSYCLDVVDVMVKREHSAPDGSLARRVRKMFEIISETNASGGVT
jgi:hypothetical protein